MNGYPDVHDDFIKLYKGSSRGSFLAIAILSLLLFVSRLNLFPFFTTRFIGGAQGDAGIYLWLAENSFFLSKNVPWFYTNAFYPYGLSLAWSDSFILPTLLIKGLVVIGLSFPLSWNLIILGASLLTGYGMFSLLNRLTGDYWLSLFGGAVFQHYGFLTLHLGHPQLQFLFFLPFSVLLFLIALNKRSLFSGVFLGLLIGASLLTTVYYGVFIACSIFVLFGGLLLLRPKSFSLKEVGVLSLGGILGVAPSLPFVTPYLAVRKEIGERALHEAFGFAATSFSYLTSPPYSLLYSWTSSWSHTEAMLFPGIVVLIGGLLGASRLVETKRLLVPGGVALGAFAALIIASGSEAHFPTYSIQIHYVTSLFSWIFLFSIIFLIFRLGALERKLNLKVISGRDLSAIFALLGAVSFLISLGPLGYPEENTIALGVHRVFYEAFPGVDGIRAISRIGIVTIFSLVTLLILWGSHVTKKYISFKPIFTLLLIFGILENNVTTYPIEEDRPAPLIFEKLKTSASLGDSVLVLPMTNDILPSGGVAKWGDFARRNVDYMRWSAPFLTVNGFSGIRTRVLKEFPSSMEGFPDRRSLESLKKIAALRFVVYLGSSITSFDESKFMKEISSVPGISVIEKDDLGNLLIKISGERRLDDGSFIAVPPKANGVLKLSVKIPYEKDAPSRRVRVFSGDPKMLVSDLEFKASGEWNKISIVIPETQQKVKPLQISFQTSDGALLYSKDEEYFFREQVL